MFAKFFSSLALTLAINVVIADPVSLRVKERKITIDGKEATTYCIVQPDGTFGLTATQGEKFDVILQNDLNLPTSVHWHGLILPSDQDGVAFITQFPIYPKNSYHYQFPIVQAGTYWMHSHFGLQIQKLLSAPLILKNPDDLQIADSEAVLFLTDFSFKSPEEIYEALRCQGKAMSAMKMGPDLTEVDYDAFLANARTLEGPDVIEVKAGSKVRLRIINGSSATNFFIYLNDLKGDAIAFDGNRIAPVAGSTFELAVAQRIDVVVNIPENGGAFAILAQGEGTDKQTGIVLATKGSDTPKLGMQAKSKAPALSYTQERLFRPITPLPPKSPDQRFLLELGGNMENYAWTINGQIWPNVTPLVVEKGKRIEITFKNVSTMSHPMHLHGHVFQVTAIDGQAFNGAMRDTVLVLPNSSVTIQFDANNPGVWPLHCHVLYHQEGGMMTVLRYKDYIQPLSP